MIREAHAEWRGGMKDGQGLISSKSGALKSAPYSFGTRFENANGTNPEELIGAAHAGCFSMALAFALADAGFQPQEIKTDAHVIFENVQSKWTITDVKLTTVAKIPEISEAKFHYIAAQAKANCPVSRVLNARISLDAKLTK